MRTCADEFGVMNIGLRIMSLVIGVSFLTLSGYLFGYPLVMMYSWGWLTFIYLPASWIAALFPLSLGLGVVGAALEV